MKRKVFSLVLLLGIGIMALQIPFSVLVGGENQHFSLFDFMAPSLGGFLGPFVGVISVIGIKVVNVLIHKGSFDMVTIIRLFPLAAGALYFSLKKYRPLMAIIPVAAIILFVAHPEGRAAWYYSLYWLIPIVALFARKSLVFTALGSTFTAHAVGGVAFLYAFNLPAAAWIALIPVVFVERMIFTAGVVVFYLVTNSALAKLSTFPRFSVVSRLVNHNYVLSSTFFKKFV